MPFTLKRQKIQQEIALDIIKAFIKLISIFSKDKNESNLQHFVSSKNQTKSSIHLAIQVKAKQYAIHLHAHMRIEM